MLYKQLFCILPADLYGSLPNNCIQIVLRVIFLDVAVGSRRLYNISRLVFVLLS